ncbi:MAG: TlpA family protein disulfide reductase [Cyclobacteriaceae bacterium]|nr:TlpA family protein disulfide reductase [Cyclobacteriaceae bacterium]MDW8330539.1 TlpA disulfide reductase family protein [Cyclobacteriaceae bacterium]
MKRILFYLLLIMVSCRPEDPKLSTGIWRGTLFIQNRELPFVFDISREKDKYAFTLHNASERIRLDSLTFSGDSVNIYFPVFDASFRAACSKEALRGYFTIHYADNYRIPFQAIHGQSFRFITSDTNTHIHPDFTGTYAVEFINPDNTVPAVFIVRQKGNYAEGTFLTPYGDYRYLEGNIVRDTLWLSALDGNHVYLFNATLKGDSITGTHWLGRSRNRPWRGVRNEKAKLPPAESLTYLREGYEKLEFTFPDVSGKPVSLQDEMFRNKVVIVQLLGTWCPNCVDETAFLAKWYPGNRHRGVEIIGLAYEQKDDFEYAARRVKILKQKLNVAYPILIAGVSDKAKAAQTLPALNDVIAFPTTILIGKDGKVKHIHTGFSGPGTGKHFDEWVEQFNEIVNKLLSEQTEMRQ